MPKKKAVWKKTTKKKPARAKAVTRSKTSPRPKAAAAKLAKARRPARVKKRKKTRVSTHGTASPAGTIAFPRRGMGADAGGQSGDTEGLSSLAHADSESVEELTEEGQAFEAEAVSGVENAPDADEGEVTTHEVPEDDVPREYDDEEQ